MQAALAGAGYTVTVLEAPEAHGGEFVRLDVSRAGRSVHVDVARDWRQHTPVQLDVGPVLHLDDAVGSKLTAMLGRGLPRDYIDVAAATLRYQREQLLHLVFTRDPGLRVLDMAQAPLMTGPQSRERCSMSRETPTPARLTRRGPSSETLAT